MSGLENIQLPPVDDVYWFQGAADRSHISFQADGIDRRTNYDISVSEVADRYKLPITMLPSGEILGVNFNNIGDLPLIKKPNLLWLEGDHDHTNVVATIDTGMGDIPLTFPIDLIATHFNIPLTLGHPALGINFDNNNVEGMYSAHIKNNQLTLEAPPQKFSHVLYADSCKERAPESALHFKNGSLLITPFSIRELEQLKCQRPIPAALTWQELSQRITFNS